MSTISESTRKPLWRSHRKRAITDAVVRILCEEGIDAITMERVAETAGIAKGTIYLHYADKQELLDEVKEASLTPITNKVMDLFASDIAPDRKIVAFSLRYLGYFDEHRDLFRVLLYEREFTRSGASRFRSERYRTLLEATTAVIEAGIEQKIFRPVDARKTAGMFLEAHLALIAQRLLGMDPLPVEEDARLVTDLFLSGVGIPSVPNPDGAQPRRATRTRSAK
ncbi:MAG: TetR/AcrR family transcriptional regulator [Thermoanaerobaculia bacterium]